ncbi:MAG: hypothetical protein AB1393_09970 [Candidatus Edwardsbacteria bacterium]
MKPKKSFKEPEKILIIKLRALGDVLLSTLADQLISEEGVQIILLGSKREETDLHYLQNLMKQPCSMLS